MRYISPLVAYKSYPLHALPEAFSPNGRNVLGLRAQLGYIQGFGGDVAPPNNRFYAGGEAELRGFDVRGATPYGYVPNRVNRPAHQSRRNLRAARPQQSAVEPVHPGAAAGLRHRLHRRRHQLDQQRSNTAFPSSGRSRSRSSTTSASTLAINKGQLKQSPEGFASLTAPLYGCPVYNNGSCQGGIPGSQVGFQRDIRPVARHQLCSPHVARRRDLRHHAGHQRAIPPLLCLQPAAPLRAALLQRRLPSAPRYQSCSAELITRDMFPPGGAGDYTYQQAIQGYGAQNLFREPRKTFRLTVSTTF